MFIYSTPLSVLLFNEDFKLQQRIKISDTEKAIAALSKNEWLPEETAAVKKALGEGKSVVVLGFKKDKIVDVALSQDIKKLTQASEKASASATADEFGKLRQLVINFTKKAVAAAVTDDNLIIQASSAINELGKTASLLAKRLMEWYGLYFPEAAENFVNNEEFVNEILSSSKEQLLQRFHVKEGMGAELGKEHVDKILLLAATIRQAYENKKLLTSYVEELMRKRCPNLAIVATAAIGAELITLAGSLRRLAMMPASTIQLLGAEKALFRHLKEKMKDKRQKPPQFGILHLHPFVAAAPRSEQGKIARIIADKISIAARVDYFKGKFMGDQLLEDVKKKLQPQ